jgi:predicted hydrolase (HD superfamily)
LRQFTRVGVVAVAQTRGQFADPEKRECLALEAVTRSLVRTVTEDTNVYVTVMYEI